MPSYEEMKLGYGNLWRKAEVPEKLRSKVLVVVERIIRNRGRYEAVETATGVPWFWIACVHEREASGSFLGVLHNGEEIIGTGQLTRKVPAGCGPFATWEEAATDALRLKGLDRITAWVIARFLFEWERFNGWGYESRGVNTPYLWADTDLEQLGKFYADGKFDPTIDDQQTGCAAMLKLLCELLPDVAARVNGTPLPVPSAPVTPNATGGSLIARVLGVLVGLLLGTRSPSPKPADTARSIVAEPPWMSGARTDIGFKETGSNRGIDRFIASAKTGKPGDAYCAIWINAKLEDAGIKGSRSAMARSFETDPNFIRLDEPALGCVVTMWRTSKASGQGHCFFYTGENAAGVWGIGANEDDGIREAPHDRARITGCWWPRSVPLPKTGVINLTATGKPATSEV